MPNQLRAPPLAFLFPLFVLSGFSALIYEIVWFQLLEFVIGSSAVSLGVLLGTFMGGMCLGSLAVPRFLPRRIHPLRAYALLEFAIGAIGIAVLFGMPWLDRLYIASAAEGLTGFLVRGAVSAACLLPPTILMGATLPAVARLLETTLEGMSRLGFLYGGNIAGAVAGCLVAGFYLLRLFDMATATWVAAAANGLVAVAALGASIGWPHAAPVEPASADAPARSPGARGVYLAIGISGFCAMGSEVIWTRLLALLLGGTVYTFSVILAVFLSGLGLGSGAGSFLAERVGRPRVALGLCQLALMAAIAWAAHALAESLPYWPINPLLASDPSFNLQIDLMRCIWAVLPAALLWGASFPLALAAAASRGGDPARLVGRVYAANTLGAIAGALLLGMLLVPMTDSQQAQRVLVALTALAALAAVAPDRAARDGGRAAFPRAAVVVTMLSVPLAVVLAWRIPAVPGGLIAHGRFLALRGGVGPQEEIEFREGMNASIAVTRWGTISTSFHVSGKTEASTQPKDMRLQRMLGHLPALFHPRPRSVLVVGCGAGVTAGSFLVHPDVERVVICEIEPLVPGFAEKYFAKQNYGVVGHPRVEIVYDDARHYILRTGERFDVITSDPIHPWVKGSAALYTREYFELCRAHLNPGGVISQWVPLYESTEETVKSECATFFEVFPDGTMWANDDAGVGYDTVLVGSAGAIVVDVDRLEERLASAGHGPVAESLAEVGFGSARDLLSTYAGRAGELGPWFEDAPVNTDRNLRLQYLAGMGLNAYDESAIYASILSRRTFPAGILVGSEQSLSALAESIEKGAPPAGMGHGHHPPPEEGPPGKGPVEEGE